MLSSIAKKLLANVLIWIEVSEQRNALRELTDRQLDDIGVSRQGAIYEADRAFWDHSRSPVEDEFKPAFKVSSAPETKL